MNLIRFTLNASMGGTAEYTVNTDTWQVVYTGGAVLHSEEFIIEQAQLFFNASSQYQGQEPPYRPPKGKPGRPHLDDDIWAYEQVFDHKRPVTDVYNEWLERDGVKRRNLLEPERHFKRIMKREWR